MSIKSKYFKPPNILNPAPTCCQVIQLYPYELKMQIVNELLLDYLTTFGYTIFPTNPPRIYVANPRDYSEFLVSISDFYN